jgi:hypothetical protein
MSHPQLRIVTQTFGEGAKALVKASPSIQRVFNSAASRSDWERPEQLLWKYLRSRPEDQDRMINEIILAKPRRPLTARPRELIVQLAAIASDWADSRDDPPPAIGPGEFLVKRGGHDLHFEISDQLEFGWHYSDSRLGGLWVFYIKHPQGESLEGSTLRESAEAAGFSLRQEDKTD